MDFERALSTCRVAYSEKNYVALHAAATEALGFHEDDYEAHQFHSIASFSLKHFDDASHSCEQILTIGGAPMSLRNFSKAMLRAIAIIRRIASRDPTSNVTERLTDEWYAKTLNERIASGALEIVLPVHDAHSAAQVASSTSEETAGDRGSIEDVLGCVLVRLLGDDYGEPLIMEYLTGDENAKAIPASVFKGVPLDQAMNGYMFQKNSVHDVWTPAVRNGIWRTVPMPSSDEFELDDDDDDDAVFPPAPIYRFPTFETALGDDVNSLGCELMDIFYSTNAVPRDTHEKLTNSLDHLAAIRQESPAPNYHNIIDPNVGAVNNHWVPTEFEVRAMETSNIMALISKYAQVAVGSDLPAEILNHIQKFAGGHGILYGEISSSIPDLTPHAHAKLYASVESVFNAALPMLARLRRPAMLLPGPVQVVVKAQRIVLRKDEKYEGVWHDDGLNEHIVAVVLYYYRVSESLRGGAMELATKAGTPLSGWNGDAEEEAYVRNLERRQVPVKEGTLLVFSNYAAVHRVLHMVARGGPGSRDFLALFVVDQRYPLDVPASLGPRSERLLKRDNLLRKQLVARGTFGIGTYSTGNSSASDLQWIKTRGRQDYEYNYGGAALDLLNTPGGSALSPRNAPGGASNFV